MRYPFDQLRLSTVRFVISAELAHQVASGARKQVLAVVVALARTAYGIVCGIGGA